MPIEIRELIIKVKIEESNHSALNAFDLSEMKKNLLKECKKEIRIQLKKEKER